MSARKSAIPGALPGALPPGEEILWQGAPTWRGLARHALHLRALGLYLAVIVGWFAAAAALRGDPAVGVAQGLGRAALVASVPLLLGLLYAWLAAGATAYTITNRRVVLRMGIGLQLTLNLPFAQIDGAALCTHGDGTGDIAIRVTPGSRGVSWFVLWPHARPWRLTAPQPMLRAIPDAARAGQILAGMLAELMAGMTAETMVEPMVETGSAPIYVAPSVRNVDTAKRHHGATTVTA